MFNSNRDTNYNPNDDSPSRKQRLAIYAIWTIFAHPAAFALMILVLVIDAKIGIPFQAVAVLLIAIPIIESQLLRHEIGPPQLVMWAKVVRFRRHWYTVWTSTVTAQSDHTTQGLGVLPVLSIIPRFRGNLGYFTVRPPAKHTLEYLEEIANVLAAHSPDVNKIEIDYDGPTASKGTLQAVFGKTLPQSNPTNTNTPPTPDQPVEDFIDLDWYNQKEPTS